MEREIKKFYSLAMEAYKKREFSNALSLLNRALELRKENPDILAARGNIHRDTGNYKFAVADYQSALKLLKPQDDDLLYDIYCSLGSIYKHLQNWRAALSFFTQAIEVKPREVLAYLNRAVVYKTIKDINKAIDDYTRVIKLSNWYGAYFNRGHLYELMGKRNDALNDYEKSIQFAPLECNVESIKKDIIKLTGEH